LQHLQLENGVQALLVYDPLLNENSNEVRKLGKALAASGGDASGWSCDDEADVGDDAAVAVSVRMGSWSDPPELQVRTCAFAAS
jgi:hypothetical protein